MTALLFNDLQIRTGSLFNNLKNHIVPEIFYDFNSSANIRADFAALPL
jgi:hypothetical protein